MTPHTGKLSDAGRIVDLVHPALRWEHDLALVI